MIELATAIPTILTAIIGATATYLVARTNKRGSREIALINELQEEVSRLQSRVETHDNRIDRLVEEKYDQLEYISILRSHIIKGRPPPPPPPPFFKSEEKESGDS